MSSYHVVDLVWVAREVLVDKIERIPSKEDVFVETFGFTVCSESFVHKKIDVEVNSRFKTFFLHPTTSVSNELDLGASAHSS